MTISEYPRLSGGTFFTLMLQALRQRMKTREHYKDECDGLRDPEVLIGLLTVINPDYAAPYNPKETLQTKANDFKSCKLSKGEYLPLGNSQEVKAFDKRVKTQYRLAFAAMTQFVSDYIEIGIAVKKDLNLVKALIDLVDSDESIRDEELFYIHPDGSTTKKAAFSDLDKVNLLVFLLGIWYYVVVFRKNNRVGEKTYDAWCPPNGGDPREYSGEMGLRITKDIELEPGVDDTDETASMEEAAESEQQTEYEQQEPNGPAPEQKYQQVNNPVVFSFTMNGNGQQVGKIDTQINHFHSGESHE